MDNEEIKLLDAIYNEFSEVAEDLDKTLKDNWEYEPHERNQIWTGPIERFSQLTTDAIAIGDEEKASSYLGFMEKQFQVDGENCKEAIEIYFIADLLRGIKDEKIKKWAWKLIPRGLKSLYISYSRELEE